MKAERRSVGMRKPHILPLGRRWCERHRAYEMDTYSQVLYRGSVLPVRGAVDPRSEVTVRVIQAFVRQIDEVEKMERLAVLRKGEWPYG